MSKLNLRTDTHQTKDGYPVRFIGETLTGELIWGCTKFKTMPEVIFTTDVEGRKLNGGLSSYWDLVRVKPEPVIKYLWLSTAFAMSSQGIRDSKWYDEFPDKLNGRGTAIIRPGSIWYECQIDVETGEILSMRVMK